MKDIVQETADLLRRHWDDGDFDDLPVVDAGAAIARKASDLWTSSRDTIRRAKDGYDGLDIWDLGHRLLPRLAALIEDSIRTESYRSIEGTVTEADLLSMAHFFKAYAASAEGFESLGYPLDMFSAEESRALISKADRAIEQRFISEWDAFCDTFLIREIDHNDQETNVVMRLRLKLSGRPDARNLEMTRISELRRIATMLREYCSKNYGFPFDYAKKDAPYEHLMSRPKGWKKGDIPLSVKFWGNREVIGDAQTVKDVGADYVLFTGDIAKACAVIEAWVAWLDGGMRGFDAESPLYPVADTLRQTGDGDIYNEIERRLVSEFQHVWHWLGTVILTLWV